MESIETIIKTRSGRYNNLDRSYQEYMLNMDLERIEIYNLIINELLPSFTPVEFNRFKYKVTGENCINQILLYYIDTNDDNLLLRSMREHIVSFINIDWLNYYTK